MFSPADLNQENIGGLAQKMQDPAKRMQAAQLLAAQLGPPPDAIPADGSGLAGMMQPQAQPMQPPVPQQALPVQPQPGPPPVAAPPPSPMARPQDPNAAAAYLNML